MANVSLLHDHQDFVFDWADHVDWDRRHGLLLYAETEDQRVCLLLRRADCDRDIRVHDNRGADPTLWSISAVQVRSMSDGNRSFLPNLLPMLSNLPVIGSMFSKEKLN